MSNPENLNGEPLLILLVEDNPDHAMLVTRSFEDHRIANRVVHLSDGEQALNYLHHRGEYTDPQSSPRPHLMLLDLRMPKVDGLEVLEDVKQDASLRDIPIVVLTTSASDPDVKRAYELHANSYLVKPVEFDKFSKLINDLGFYWLGWNHQPWSGQFEQLPVDSAIT